MHAVATGLSNEVEHSAAGAAVFGRRRGADYFELADDLCRRGNGRLALAADLNGNSVEQDVIVSADTTIRLEIIRCRRNYSASGNVYSDSKVRTKEDRDVDGQAVTNKSKGKEGAGAEVAI
jgi:hypothetical protein